MTDMSTIENNLPEIGQTEPKSSSPTPPKASSSWLLAGLAAAVLVLGIVIYSGIHERAHAETALGVSTERAAVPTVNVVRPTSGSQSQEIVLPGNTQAFNDTPIYARTNGYLKRWYVDIGAHVAQAKSAQNELRLQAGDRSGCPGSERTAGIR
jgi:hypothetical protein